LLRRCQIIGCPGDAASDFADALMTFGAQAAWIEERPGQESNANASTEKTYPGQGRHWLAAVWIECQVVALFDADESQVASNPATVPL
jgi:hypothetical protein